MTTFLIGQDFKTAWGKVSKEDLEMKSCSFDSEADAMILHDIGQVYLEYYEGDFRSVLKRHKRIKFFNEQGFEYGDITIPFYSHDKIAEIVNIDVQVIAPDGTKTKLPKKEIFTEKVNRFYSQVKFAAPNLTPGSILEFKYELTNEIILDLIDWYFQGDIPNRYSKLIKTNPDYYDYVALTQGDKLFTIKNEFGHERVNVFQEGKNVYGGRIPSGTDTYEYETEIDSYIAEKVPAFSDEAFIASRINHMARIRFQLQAIENEYGVKDYIFGSWDDLQRKMLNNPGIGGKLKEGNGKNLFLASGINESDSQYEKLEKIYSYLKTSVSWNNVISFRADKGADKILKEKSANIAEINFALISALKNAEILAFPIFTSTRSRGFCIEVYPIIDQFNYVIAGAIIDDKLIILDAGDPYLSPNFINKSALNKKGWYFTKDQQGWMDINSAKTTATFQEILELDGNGTISGTTKIRSKGYFAIDKSKAATAGKIEDYYENWFDNKVSISNHNIDDSKISSGKLEESMNIQTDEYGKLRKDILYLNPVLSSIFDENPLKQESRDYPIDLHFPTKRKFITNIKLPEGYSIESIPEGLKTQFGDQQIKYSYTANEVDGTLQLIRDFSVNITQIHQDYYADLKTFLEQIVQKEQEQIVLKKND